ncbi:MAG: VIT1/CCC1 transporter family protein [Planctomycetaceae bacterium]
MSDLETQHSHTPEGIRLRLGAKADHSYLRDFVYGGIDGAVTTFAVVSGVAGAELSSGIVIVLGLANLLGDGFSMAAGNFLGSRADLQLLDAAREMEEKHIDRYPDGEREEIRQIYAKKGFEGDDLERAVTIITSDKKLWIDTMLREELGFALDRPNPMRAALVTFGSFLAIGILPLIVFLIDYFSPLSNPFLYSSVLTAGAFFIVGAVKARFVAQKWYFAGMETVAVGGIAAGLAYVVGMALKRVL